MLELLQDEEYYTATLSTLPQATAATAQSIEKARHTLSLARTFCMSSGSVSSAAESRLMCQAGHKLRPQRVFTTSA